MSSDTIVHEPTNIPLAFAGLTSETIAYTITEGTKKMQTVLSLLKNMDLDEPTLIH